MKIFIILSLFVVGALCANGVDVSSAVSTADYSCMVKQGYTFAIPRCFQSTGVVDPNCASNVANALSAGMDVDIYMFPCFKCGNAFDQMSNLVNYTKQHGVKYKNLWLDIEGTQYWGAVSANVAFMQQLLSAGEHLGVLMGVYTSQSQWTPIMGSSTIGASYPIWYAHYDNDQSFKDFTSFGGWKTPYMKQYNGDQTLCGAGVDYNWMPGGNSTTVSTVATTATHATATTATHTATTDNTATHATATTKDNTATTHTATTATHATSDNGPATHATSDHSTNGPASSTSKTTSGTSQTQTTYSGGSDSSGSDFNFLDRATYNAKIGGNKIPIVHDVLEVKKEAKVEAKKISIKFSEVEDAMEKDSHFKVLEEKTFDKF